jgi:RNA polymerase sigma-70 factor (ECF subfamily)
MTSDHRADDGWKAAASVAMDRYALGKEESFSELYDVLAPRLASFALRRTRDRAQAEDVVQQTFLQMHGARRHFVRGASAAAWAFAIARRILIDGHRRSGRAILVELEGDGGEGQRESVAPAALPDRVAANRRLARQVDRELERLPDANRTAFELVHRDGLTAAEAAEVLGTTAMAVRLRVHRAYEALRAVLGDQVREELAG